MPAMFELINFSETGWGGALLKGLWMTLQISAGAFVLGLVIGPYDPIYALDEAWGIDLEAEVAVITGDVPMGTAIADAAKAIRLVMLVNDVSLRNLIPNELAKGFGFFQSKAASAFSPVAVTPDELGAELPQEPVRF